MAPSPSGEETKSMGCSMPPSLSGEDTKSMALSAVPSSASANASANSFPRDAAISGLNSGTSSLPGLLLVNHINGTLLIHCEWTVVRCSLLRQCLCHLLKVGECRALLLCVAPFLSPLRRCAHQVRTPLLELGNVGGVIVLLLCALLLRAISRFLLPSASP